VVVVAITFRFEWSESADHFRVVSSNGYVTGWLEHNDQWADYTAEEVWDIIYGERS